MSKDVDFWGFHYEPVSVRMRLFGADGIHIEALGCSVSV